MLYQYYYLIRRLTSQYGWIFLRVGSILVSLIILLLSSPASTYFS